MKFYKRFIGDYQRDTGHLTLIEHGAYTLLLDAYYATGQPLPLDQEIMHRLVRAISSEERAAVDAVLAQFWTEAENGWVNARSDREISDFRVRVSRAHKAASKRWGSAVAGSPCDAETIVEALEVVRVNGERAGRQARRMLRAIKAGDPPSYHDLLHHLA